MKKPFVILMLGLPGTGKGTQGGLLAKHFRCLNLIAGDFVREVYQEGPIDDLHKDLIQRYDKGLLMTDETMVGIFNLKVQRHVAKFKHGLVIDDYPMSMGQLTSMEEFVQKYNLADPLVLVMEVPEAEILTRLGKGRWICVDCRKTHDARYVTDIKKYCQECEGQLTRRHDDKPEIILSRINIWKKRLEPIFDYYEKQGRVIRVNGSRPVDEVFKDILKELKKRKIV